MLDPKLLRTNLDLVAKQLERRGFALDVTKIKALEEQRKGLQSRTQELQSNQNKSAKDIGRVKASGGDITPLLQKVDQLKQDKKRAEEQLTFLQGLIEALYLEIPNLLADDVPVGDNEDSNVEIYQWGAPKVFDFDVKDHADLGEQLNGLDFKLGTKITGSRFAVMKNGIARMHRALIQFMLDTHCDIHEYNEVNVPYIVNKESLYGTGQLPKFKDDLFKLHGDKEYYLIPTAEVPVTNIMRDEIINGSELPLKFACHTPCFRSEAGSAGRDIRGLIRQHQFEKVELVQFVKPEDSDNALEQLTCDAERILQILDLPYRKMLLCAGDVGFSARKTYDLEVWLPSQDTYREISSCSSFGDFQARRMGARYRDNDKAKPELLHTINGSGLAVGRTLVAILENNQESDGSIKIPEALQRYMGGKLSISLN